MQHEVKIVVEVEHDALSDAPRGLHAPAVDFRGDSVLGKIDLLKRGELSTAIQGGIGGDWRHKNEMKTR